MLRDCLSSSSFSRHFSVITGNSEQKKKNFTDNQTANTIQLLVAKKRRS